MRRVMVAAFVGLLVALPAAGCGGDDDGGAGDRLLVVATTTQIEDMARVIGGGRVEVAGLLPANADAHDFEPTPRDVDRVADADLVLEHGLHLDTWAEDLVRESGTDATIVTVTAGIVPLNEEEEEHPEEATPGAGAEDEHEHEHGPEDPHVWFDVANAKVMAANIRDALIAADPDGRAEYEANAAAYLAELDALDAWIREQVATVPPENRKLVTTHDALGYYVRAYGFEYVGAIIPGIDTQAQPSAQETAALLDAIAAAGVKAIFTEASLNPDLARQIAEEARVTVVDDLYVDSLGPDGSGAETYIGMMRTNTTKIVEALR